MFRITAFVIAITVSSLGISAQAADTPTPLAGVLYSDTATAHLQFVCDTPIGDKMTCKFHRAKIRKKTENICDISITSFEMTFTRGATEKVWSSVSEPDRLCGEIVIGSFETAADEYQFWTFTSRVVVTNKNRKLNKSFDCSTFKDTTDLYIWRNDRIPIGCQFLSYH